MSGNGSRGVSTILTIVALVAVGGFLAWLYWRSQEAPEPVAPVTEAEAEAGDAVGAGRLLNDPQAAVGRRGALDSLPVAQRLGRAAFAVQINGDRYPILLTTELMQRQVEVYGGDMVSLRGQVYVLNDSIRAAWVDQGLVDPANRQDLPTTPSFLLADSVRVF